MDQCYFKCNVEDQPLTLAGPERIQTIIQASKQRGDNLYVQLQKLLVEDNTLTIPCHRNCVSTYTSSSHIARYIKNLENRAKRSSSEPPAVKRVCRSELTDFNFKEHCLFCGQICSLEKDPRQPGRWRKHFYAELLTAQAEILSRKLYCKSVKSEMTSRQETYISDFKVL